MEIAAAVTTRLAALGFAVAPEDEEAVRFNIDKAALRLKAKTNQREVPEGLFNVWVDMAAGLFLQDKKAAGQLPSNFNLSAPVKSVKEGDTSVTFALAEAGSSFDVLLARLVEPDEETIIAFRRLAW